MKLFWRKFVDRQSDPEPLITVTLSRANLLHNLETFSRLVMPSKIAPMLKSNAYGHGLFEIAEMLNGRPEVAFLAVDSYYEARVLRTKGIDAPILVVGHTRAETIAKSPFKHVAFTIGSLSELRDVAERRVAAPLHIKFDTGMHRQGVMKHELDETFKLITDNRQLNIEGICSHLADADGEDPTFTEGQIASWNAIVAEWKKHVPDTKLFHLSATKGFPFVSKIDANVVRLGIGLYGISKRIEELRPVLEMHTSVTALRTIPKGDHVGYNCTFTAKRETRVATIPVGYYEGLDRRLSNKGFVTVNGVVCPVIGRVSMNMATIDVTSVPDVAVGDAVVVISNKRDDKNSVAQMAELSHTIPYDILVHIPTTLRRRVV